MKQRSLRVMVILLISFLFVISANAYSSDLMSNYLPIVVNNYGAVISPSPSPSLTPTSTVTSPPGDTGLVEIKFIFYAGTGTSEPNEYVEIRNEESFPIQLNNWTLRDVADHIFTFPSFEIQPDQVCRVYTNEYHPEWCGFNYGSGTAIWNNSGDTAYLRDSNGILIDDYSY